MMPEMLHTFRWVSLGFFPLRSKQKTQWRNQQAQPPASALRPREPILFPQGRLVTRELCEGARTPSSRRASRAPKNLVLQEAYTQEDLGAQARPPGTGTAFGHTVGQDLVELGHWLDS